MEVNSESLLGLHNTEAMDILREAMHKEGVTEGFIDIKIARKIGAPSPYPAQDGATMDLIGAYQPLHAQEPEGDSNSDSDDNDGREVVKDVTRNMQNTEEPSSKLKENAIKNPALLRLSEQSGLRNESYSKAVHETSGEGTEGIEDTAVRKERTYTNPRLAAVVDPGGLHNDSYAKAIHGPSDNSLISVMQSTEKSRSVSPSSEDMVYVANDEQSAERVIFSIIDFWMTFLNHLGIQSDLCKAASHAKDQNLLLTAEHM